jgi:predicted metalloprotease with PDZ domain
VGATYWGGALFCLIADIRIRQQTKNVFGLQDALTAIVHAHASIKDEWPIERVLAVADKRTGTTVLEDLYKSWRATPIKVDLAGLWSQLGIRDSQEGVIFDDSAPLASVRDTILHP